MCGRYYLDIEQSRDIRDILEEIGEIYKGTPELSLMKTGEIFPANIAPVITANFPALMKWGFSRFDGKGEVINARLETAPEKPMFRKPFFEQRCLIPASYFFEWERTETGKKKYMLGLKEPLYMAALYRIEHGEVLPRFVILTREAAPGIAFIHDRMPVILARGLHKTWLTEHLDNNQVSKLSLNDLLYEAAE